MQLSFIKWNIYWFVRFVHNTNTNTIEVTKIDIKKEKIEIKDDENHVSMIRLNSISKIIDKNSILDYSVDAVKDEYKVIKINDRHTIKKYLVKVNEIDLFNLLLDVNRNNIENYIKEQIDIVIKESEEKIERLKIGHKANIKNIKKLIWYKRLFNKF